MTVAGRAAWLAFLVFAGSECQACQAPQTDESVLDSPTALARAAHLKKELADHDTAGAPSAPLAQWLLPPTLREISGLALTNDGRLFVEQDELGAVWQVDYRRGALIKGFSLGPNAVRGDFEAIAVADSTIFLLTSKGMLYQFREGKKNEQVAYTVHDTGLGTQCEFEGVAYDRSIQSLVLACKHVFDPTVHDDIVLYRWRLDGTAPPSRLAVPMSDVIGNNEWTSLHPSDITVDPLTGDYVIVASAERAIFEITPEGEAVFARPLPSGHDQPEGVAITQDSILIVSDEAKTRPAMITLYRWK